MGTLGNLSCKTDVTHFKFLMTYPRAMLNDKTDQQLFSNVSYLWALHVATLL